MRNLGRQAVFFFLLPLVVLLAIGLPYALSSRFRVAITEGPSAPDWTIWILLLIAVILPPIWGYRLTIRIASALSHATDVARRVAEGDFSRSLTAWAAETSDMFHLEESINATAAHFQERLSELSTEKARLEAVLSNMAEGLVLIDAKRRVTLVNTAAEGMLGIRATEALGRDSLEVTHHFALDEMMQRVLATGEPQVIEIKRARPEEQILEGRLVRAHKVTPEARGVLLVLRDITRFRKLEQMRTDFVSNVTHELRTPLTAIRGFAETLLEGALDDPADARHFVGIIKRESDHLGGLIEDILDLSRIESGKWHVRKEPLHLGTLAAETVGRLLAKAQDLDVHVYVDIPSSLPSVPGDPTRLSQVFVNLIDNALKYTPSGGSVTVSAADQGPYISVRVSDTGVGIPKAELPRIFERFYRVDKARTRATGGTGLGLSIVKHIVDAHGGTIGVVSDVGQGAEFTFTLPKS